MSFCYILVFVTDFYFYMNHYKQQNENMKFIIYFLVTFFVKMSRWVFLVTWDMSYFTSKCLWLFFNHIWHVVVHVKCLWPFLITYIVYKCSGYSKYILACVIWLWCHLKLTIWNAPTLYLLKIDTINYCGQTWSTSKSL
jgi:hypothetical protein